MAEIFIQVSEAPLDHAAEFSRLAEGNCQDGAVVTFTGLVREHNQGAEVTTLMLEHYPGMTEKVLTDIAEQACARWPLGRVSVVHRVGPMTLSDLIVFVGVTAKHRQDAFAAASFIMDFLKTQAPFWKKEQTSSGERWVEANHKDHLAAKNW